MQKPRLLNVAKALRESPNPVEFSMNQYGSNAGTPVCPMGHYAERQDLQTAFSLDGEGDLRFSHHDPRDKNEEICQYYDPYVLEHFDISEPEAEILFGTNGCGHADTALEAAQFIEGFVALHR